MNLASNIYVVSGQIKSNQGMLAIQRGIGKKKLTNTHTTMASYFALL